LRLVYIKVKNFATYADADVDFQKFAYPLFVAGKTGAGKTTLIVDALTAALYGAAYGQERSTKNVIRAGAPNSYVELHFEVDGVIYKIHRTFYSSRHPSSVVLEEMVGSAWRIIAEGDRTVSEEIMKLVKLDYDTMLNSVIVRQGDVLSFVNMDPAERRDLLLNIFNLHFEKVYNKAKEKLDSTTLELKDIERRIRDAEEKVSREGELNAQIQKCQERLDNLKAQERGLNAQKVTIQKEIEISYTNISEIESKLKLIMEKENQLKELSKQREKLEKEMTNLNKIISKYTEHQLNMVEELRKELIQYWQLKGELEKLRVEASRLSDLHVKQKKLKSTQEELKPFLDKRLDNEKDNLQSLINEKYSELGQLKSKLQSVREYSKIVDNAEAECPICHRPLDAVMRQNLISHFQLEEQKISEELRMAEFQLRELRKQLNLVEKNIKRRDELITTIKNLEESLKGFNEDKLYELNQGIEVKTNELKNLEEKIRISTGVDPVNAEMVLTEMKEASRAMTSVSEIKNNLSETSQKIKNLENEIAKKQEIERKHIQEKAKLERLRSQLDMIDEQLAIISKEIGSFEESIKHMTRELSEIKNLKEQLKELQRQQKNLQLDQAAYAVLTEIFSPSHLPLRLLQEHVRIISQYAKHYVKVFSPDMDIEIDLLHEQKKPERAKIEIKVMANSYVRPFDTYSGGETTLVGFAVRLAIGRALAEMLAGTRRPRFLIIDEGFGPLDEGLRSKVADSLLELYSTKEYEQIIVISHQLDLKSHPAFQAVLEIEKGDDNISRIKQLEERLVT